MSRTTRVFDCTPDDIFEVLADGWSYATWVVGAARIRAVDEEWPEAGSRIHHSVGLWPLLISDTTSMVEWAPPHHVTLTVRAWPAGQGEVTIACTPESGRTRVVMTEDATSGPATLVPKIGRDPMLHVRNLETLRRLAYLAENRNPPGEAAPEG